jgi:hypothetical protein
MVRYLRDHHFTVPSSRLHTLWNDTRSASSPRSVRLVNQSIIPDYAGLRQVQPYQSRHVSCVRTWPTWRAWVESPPDNDSPLFLLAQHDNLLCWIAVLTCIIQFRLPNAIEGDNVTKPEKIFGVWNVRVWTKTWKSRVKVSEGRWLDNNSITLDIAYADNGLCSFNSFSDFYNNHPNQDHQSLCH